MRWQLDVCRGRLSDWLPPSLHCKGGHGEGKAGWAWDGGWPGASEDTCFPNCLHSVNSFLAQQKSRLFCTCKENNFWYFPIPHPMGFDLIKVCMEQDGERRCSVRGPLCHTCPGHGQILARDAHCSEAFLLCCEVSASQAGCRGWASLHSLACAWPQRQPIGSPQGKAVGFLGPWPGPWACVSSAFRQVASGVRCRGLSHPWDRKPGRCFLHFATSYREGLGRCRAGGGDCLMLEEAACRVCCAWVPWRGCRRPCLARTLSWCQARAWGCSV